MLPRTVARPLRARPVAAAVLACAALVTLSGLYVDRPVTRFVYHHMHHRLFFEALASPSLVPPPASILFLLVYAQRCFSGRKPWPHTPVFLCMSIATAVGTLAKDELKWVFGRPWPITWVKFGIYHPHFFRDDVWFGSFPSGHTTYIAAPMFVLWWLVPRYRWLWLGIIFMVMIGLVGGGFHFVSDTIAGLFLGLAVATGTVVGARVRWQ